MRCGILHESDQSRRLIEVKNEASFFGTSVGSCLTHGSSYVIFMEHYELLREHKHFVFSGQ